MPVDTDPGPAEERTLDSVVLSGRSGKERKKRKKEKKKKEKEKKEEKKRLKMSDIQQIWTLFWWKRHRRRSYLQRSQSASWLQPTVWLQERICVSQRGHVESPSPSARPGNL